jgi:hypothetical protein
MEKKTPTAPDEQPPQSVRITLAAQLRERVKGMIERDLLMLNDTINEASRLEREVCVAYGFEHPLSTMAAEVRGNTLAARHCAQRALARLKEHQEAGE